MSINKSRLKSSFHRQAVEYDQHTSVQKRVVDRLVTLVGEHVSGTPSQVLDIGCGTGRLLALLDRQYPHARQFGLDLAYNMTRHARERLDHNAVLVQGDAEQLPFWQDSFDLVVSSSTLQWRDDLAPFFRQCRLVVKDGGQLCVAFFGGRTLQELHECYRDAAGKLSGDSAGTTTERLHRFKPRAEVESVLEQAGFETLLLTSEIEMDYYSGVPELLRSIKRIGAGSSAQGSTSGGLGWRGVLNETSRLYHQRYGSDGMIPVTYEVFYIIARCGGRV